MEFLRLMLLVAVSVSNISADSHGNGNNEAEVVYQWNIVEYEWPNDTYKEEQITSGNYIPQNSAVHGIKLYKGRVYVTVPRLKPGVPSSLNVIIDAPESFNRSEHLLRPFPSWEMQELGNCEAIQRVQSMEIDPQTGYMWIVDTGYIPNMKDVEVQPVDSCPAKMIIYDIDNNVEVRRYIFPKSTVGYGLFYLNDIVLSYSEGKARYAFISETLGYKLVVYDYKKNTSYYYAHANMVADEKYENITINNLTLTGIITGINGIAISPDFKYLYYSSVAGTGLHQIETAVLTSAEGSSSEFAANVRTVGQKVSPGDGMAYGTTNKLYYSALGPNAVYAWDIETDLKSSFGNLNQIQLKTQDVVDSDLTMEWVDTLAIDNGYLWFTTSRLNKFFSEDGIVHHEPNFFIWRIYTGDQNYMKKGKDPVQSANNTVVSIMTVFTSLLLAFLLM
ncbi:hypothetical protein ACF0H5_018401 [Mactra antiquata]